MNAHPEFERLVIWQEGQLPAPEAAGVAEHVADCSFCSRRAGRLAALAQGLRAGPGRPSEQARAAVFDAFRRIYPPRRALTARLVYDSRVMSPLPGLRAGAADGPQLLYTCAEADIALSLRVQDEGRWDLTGQLLPATATLGQPADLLVVAADRVVRQAGIDALGNFSLDALASGRYHLIALCPNLRVEIPDVALLS